MCARFNVKKLLACGIQGIADSLKNVGFNPTVYDKSIGLTTRKGNIMLEITKTDIKVGDQSLEMYFRNIEYNKGDFSNFLDFFVDANKSIFGDATTDNHDIVRKWVEEKKGKMLSIGENIYTFNGVHYDLLNLKDLEDVVYDLIRINRPVKKDVEEACYIAHMELKRMAEPFLPNAYFGYKERVALAFNDGTLYIDKDGMKFHKKHRKEDKLFFKFNVNFSELPESTGLIRHWFDVKFSKNEEIGKDDSHFVIAGLGDLFATTCYSQVMMYIYGAGGTGKSLLQDTISALLNTRATSSVNINDIGNQFKTAPLFNSVINFSSEISRKEVKSDRFKSLIARDEETLSLKFKADCKGRPLAKWFSVANSLPTIDMDSGVDRRLLPIKMLDTRIEEFNGMNLSNKDDFKQAFMSDVKGLIEVIAEGIMICMNNSFDLNRIYENTVDSSYKKEVISYNDTVAYFLELAIERTEDTTKGILKDDLFDMWNEFLHRPEGTGITKMKAQTFKARVGENGVKEKRVQRKNADTGKVENSNFFYAGYRIKDSFLKKIGKANCYYIFDSNEFKNYQPCTKKFDIENK